MSDNNVEDSIQLAENFKVKANEKYSSKEYEESIRLYGKAIELDGNNAVYYGNRAAAYIMLKKFKEALRDCEIAVAKDPKFVRGYLRLAKCHMELGEFFESKRAYQKVTELDPSCDSAFKELESLERLNLLISKAKELIEENNIKLALQYLEKASSLTYSPKIIILKCKALLKLKEFDKVASLMSKILQEDENNSDALAIRGEALYHIGNHSQAISHLNRALRCDPDHSRARELIKIVRVLEKHKEEGNNYFKEGKNKEAIESYSAALEIDPSNDAFNATLYCNRAAANMKLEKYKEAIEDCTESIKRNENYERAFTRRANCYYALKKFDDAIADYHQASTLAPENREIKEKLKDAKRQAKIANRKDYYAILDLGNNKNPSEHELKKAYKRAAMKWHPDRHSSGTDEQKVEAEAKFKEVGEALALLSDPQKKARYDNGEDIEDIMNGPAGMGGMHGGVDISEIFNMFGGMGGGGMGGGGMGGGGRRGGGMPSGGFSFNGNPFGGFGGSSRGGW